MTITILTILHVLICIFMIVIVLLQHGKGADAGAAFGGGGSSQAIFGSEGPVPLLNKITTLTAIVFMLTSLSLAYLSTDRTVVSVMEDVVAPMQQEIPLIDTVPAPFPVPDDR